MRVNKYVLDLILKTCRFDYNGCHAPHSSDPLYGRAAYWRAYLPSGTYVCKITTPVDKLEPDQAELAELLRLELSRRLEDIQYVAQPDEYGMVEIRTVDPSRVFELVRAVERQDVARLYADV